MKKAMLFKEILYLLSYLTQYDIVEMAFCAVIIHVLLTSIYKRHGTQRYTFSYFFALAITISWLLSYKIISSFLMLYAFSKIILNLLSSHAVPSLSPTTLIKKYEFEENSWIETIIALSIQAFHENITLVWIIDHEENLHELLHAEITLHVYIVPKLSQIIFSTINTTNQTSVLWVNRSGYIIGINPCTEPSQKTPSHDDLITWSTHRGAIIIQSYAQKRMYSVIHKGVVRDNLSSHHAYHTLKHIFSTSSTQPLQQELL